MKHSHVDELYTAYLEGSLPEELRQEVARHLESCSRCAGELEDMRALVACLHEMSPAPAPDLVSGVRRRLATRRPVRPWFLRLPAMAAGTLAAAALAVVITILQPAMIEHAPPVPTVNIQPERPADQRKLTKRTQPHELHVQAPATAAPSVVDRAIPDPFVKPQLETGKTLPLVGKPTNSAGMTYGKAGSLPAKEKTRFRSDADTFTTLPPETPLASEPTPSMKPAAPGFIANAPGSVAPQAEQYDKAAPIAGDTLTQRAIPPNKAASVDGTADGLQAGRVSKAGPVGPGGAIGPAGPAGLARPQSPPNPSINADSMKPMSTQSANGGQANIAPKMDNNANKSIAATPPSTVTTSAMKDEVNVLAGQHLAYMRAPATIGLLRINQINVLADREAVVVVQTVAPDASTVSMRSTAGVRQMAQQYKLSTTASTAAFKVALGPGGSTLKFAVTAGKEVENSYLFAPGPRPRQDTISLTVADGPTAVLLRQLAVDGKTFIFCPSELAEGKSTITAKNVAPETLLPILASQHGYHVEGSGGVLTMAPGEKK